MKKVGILGGTFDPPHFGHLLIANEVRESLLLDEVWFMPSNISPHKQKTTTTTEERVDMVTLAIEGNPNFTLQPIELNRESVSYTYDTMKQLRELYPDTTFYFIIGGDMVEYLPKWYKIDELLSITRFVGVGRPRYSLQTPYEILSINVPQFDVSSSMIRERILEKKSIKYLLPETVREYIEEKKLYGTK